MIKMDAGSCEKESEIACRKKCDIYTLILEEMKQNKCDHINLVCQDEIVPVSSLLVAAISPMLRSAFMFSNIEEHSLILPEVQSCQIRELINIILSHKERKFTENEIDLLEQFDGVLWKDLKSNPVFSSSGFKYFIYVDDNQRNTTRSEGNDKDSIKTEEKVEIESDIKIEEFETELSYKSDLEGFPSMPIRKDNLKDYSREYKSRAISMVKSGRNHKQVARHLNIGQRTLERWWAQHKKGNNDNVSVSDLRNKEDLNIPKKKLKASKKQKEQEKTKESDDDKENDEDWSPTNETESLNDEIETGKKKEKFKKDEGSMKKEQKLSPEDMPKDEDFLRAQERLQEALIDGNVKEDPKITWERCHDVKYSTNMKKKLICPLCNTAFVTEHTYKRWNYFIQHLRNHKYANNNCACAPPDDCSDKEIQSHIQEAHWGWKKCEVCETSQPMNTKKLKDHMVRVHKKARELECEVCGKVFSINQKSLFSRHVKNHNIDKFKCDCAVKFKNRRQKIQHMNTVHNDKNYLGCDKCSFITKSEESLQEHVKKHDPSMRQICDICGFVSNSSERSAIKSHKAIHHDPVLTKCGYCDGKFNAKQLQVHMRSHKESVCNECGIKVKNLHSHIKNMHTPDHLKKFKCTYCPKGFTAVDKLMHHVYSVHTKERPFKCRYGCELAYSEPSNRNAHEKKKHGKLFVTAKKSQQQQHNSTNSPVVGFVSEDQ